MIYRKWSLLTGPARLFDGIADTIFVVDFIFRKQVGAKLLALPSLGRRSTWQNWVYMRLIGDYDLGFRDSPEFLEELLAMAARGGRDGDVQQFRAAVVDGMVEGETNKEERKRRIDFHSIDLEVFLGFVAFRNQGRIQSFSSSQPLGRKFLVN